MIGAPAGAELQRASHPQLRTGSDTSHGQWPQLTSPAAIKVVGHRLRLAAGAISQPRYYMEQPGRPQAGQHIAEGCRQDGIPLEQIEEGAEPFTALDSWM